MATDRVVDIYTQFKKEELLQVVKELEIGGVTIQTQAKKIASIILTDLDKEGIPEDLENVSDELFELLVTAGYIDETGNVLEDNINPVEEVPTKIVVEEKTYEEPPCFSFADSRDPACNRCRIFDKCMARRIETRPPCFGIMYSENAQECLACIEATFCREAVQSKK